MKQKNKYSTKAFMIGLNFLLRISEVDISVSKKAMETTYLLLTKEELWLPSRFSFIPMYYADRFISKSVLKGVISMFLFLLYLPALLSVVQHKKA